VDKSEAEASEMLARDGKLGVEELLDVMNAGELGLGELLQSALQAALVGADELARTLGDLGAEDCAAIVECLDGDGDLGAISIEEFRLMFDLL
jgi:calmodulin